MAPLISALALLTIALDVVIVGLGIVSMRAQSRARVVMFMRTHARMLTFFFSFAAVCTTLILEHVFGLTPCVLCWWQRIFMYPIFVITLVASVQNVRFAVIADYISTLAFFGVCVSLYQHLLQMLPSGTLIPCDASNDCAVRSVFEFGFVTLPWMALTLFVAILVIAIVARKAE